METIRLHSECINCMAKVHLDKCPKDAPEDQKREYMTKVLKIISEAPLDAGAPVIVRSINQLQNEMFHMNQDYSEIKKHYNQLMMAQEKRVLDHMANSDDAVKTGIQYAMIGNYIDFGARIQVKEEELAELLDHPQKYPIPEKSYQELQEDLRRGKRLVYLTDNCGEIVMDKLLVEQIKKQYPHLNITVLVRGQQVLNDATMEDALQVGLTEITTVLPNGSDIAGTWYKELPTEVKAVLDQADVIISKGQGNFETLRKCGKNIYYIFLCKCNLFADTFQVPKLTGMLINERDC